MSALSIEQPIIRVLNVLAAVTAVHSHTLFSAAVDRPARWARCTCPPASASLTWIQAANLVHGINRISKSCNVVQTSHGEQDADMEDADNLRKDMFELDQEIARAHPCPSDAQKL